MGTLYLQIKAWVYPLSNILKIIYGCKLLWSGVHKSDTRVSNYFITNRLESAVLSLDLLYMHGYNWLEPIIQSNCNKAKLLKFAVVSKILLLNNDVILWELSLK